MNLVGGAPDRNGEGIVIVNAFCNFIRQLEFPGGILAKHYVANVGRSSFDAFAMVHAQNRQRIGGGRDLHLLFIQQAPQQQAEGVMPLLCGWQQHAACHDFRAVQSAQNKWQHGAGQAAEQDNANQTARASIPHLIRNM